MFDYQRVMELDSRSLKTTHVTIPILHQIAREISGQIMSERLVDDLSFVFGQIWMQVQIWILN